jgi:acetyl esterase/lipase
VAGGWGTLEQQAPVGGMRNTFEGGLPDTDITVGTSGGTSGQVATDVHKDAGGGSVTLTFSSEAALGNVGARFLVGGDAAPAAKVYEEWSGFSGLQIYPRVYVKILPGPPAPSGATFYPDIEYDSVNHLKADLWIPKPKYSADHTPLSVGPWPVLIGPVHGGGFTKNSKLNSFTLAQEIALSGLPDVPNPPGSHWAVFNPDYRLAPLHPYPAAKDDIGTMLDFLDSIAADPKYNLDMSKVAVMGGSAGGTIALWAATFYPTRVRSVASWSGPTDMEYLLINHSTGFTTPIYSLCTGSDPSALTDGVAWSTSPPQPAGLFPAPAGAGGPHDANASPTILSPWNGNKVPFEDASPYNHLDAGTTRPIFQVFAEIDEVPQDQGTHLQTQLNALGITNQLIICTGVQAHSFALQNVLITIGGVTKTVEDWALQWLVDHL